MPQKTETGRARLQAAEDPEVFPGAPSAHKSTEEDPKVPGAHKSMEEDPKTCP